jgi:hypothetical protein
MFIFSVVLLWEGKVPCYPTWVIAFALDGAKVCVWSYGCDRTSIALMPSSWQLNEC